MSSLNRTYSSYDRSLCLGRMYPKGCPLRVESNGLLDLQIREAGILLAPASSPPYRLLFATYIIGEFATVPLFRITNVGFLFTAEPVLLVIGSINGLARSCNALVINGDPWLLS